MILTQKFLMATKMKFLKSLHNLEQLCTFIWSIKNGSFLCQTNYAVLVEFGISEDSCVICAKFTCQFQPLRRKNTWVMASKLACGKLQTFLWKWIFSKLFWIFVDIFFFVGLPLSFLVKCCRGLLWIEKIQYSCLCSCFFLTFEVNWVNESAKLF